MSPPHFCASHCLIYGGGVEACYQVLPPSATSLKIDTHTNRRVGGQDIVFSFFLKHMQITRVLSNVDLFETGYDEWTNVRERAGDHIIQSRTYSNAAWIIKRTVWYYKWFTLFDSSQASRNLSHAHHDSSHGLLDWSHDLYMTWFIVVLHDLWRRLTNFKIANLMSLLLR
jgi:hypothetical protein